MLTEFRTLSSAEIGGDLNTSGRILSGGVDLSSLFVGVSTLSAQDITYDNTKIQNGVGLDATTVQDALDELEVEKLNIRDAGTNIILFPTTTASEISGYNVMVTSTIDPAFNLSAVDVSTPPVTSNTVPTIVGQLITAPGIIIGTPGLVNITTIGNIRKVSGNRNAVFYFEVYKREDAGNEIFLCASDPTPEVDTPNYRQFAESALLPITASFIETDRIVIKYLGLKTESGGGDPVYQFQFGGSDPVRTLLPVPASVAIQETWRKNGDDIFYNLGNVGIGTDTPSSKLTVSGGLSATSINATDVTVAGHFSAATKSFKIPHQTKTGHLQYGVVESNEHGVYVRGETNGDIISLPDHWNWLVDENSVTVTLTPVGKFQPLFVISKNNKEVIIGGVDGVYNYVVYGTRKDVEPLTVEI